MLMTVAGIEILVGVAGKIAQTLDFVLHGMRVNDVHDDGNALGMGRIDKGLQLLGCAETARRGKERTHVVAEGAVVRVLLYGHNLNAVVACLDHARQHIVLEFRVGSHLFGILSHADVALINQQR